MCIENITLRLADGIKDEEKTHKGIRTHFLMNSFGGIYFRKAWEESQFKIKFDQKIKWKKLRAQFFRFYLNLQNHLKYSSLKEKTVIQNYHF